MNDENALKSADRTTRKDKQQGFWQANKRKIKEEADKQQKLNFERKRRKQENDNSQFSMLPMCGYEVKLPFGLQPYPTQKLMMVRILTALNSKQNVIAESPTGSGKTLALLASTCAWLFKYKTQFTESRDHCPVHGRFRGEQLNHKEANKLDDSTMSVEEALSPLKEANETIHMEFDDDDFVHPLKTLSSQKPSAPSTQKSDKESKPVCSCLPRVRIYYGTRTHKQIGQVVKEFRRLPYAGLIRHTILASRDQSCINPEARKNRDVTSFCKDLLTDKGLGCCYKTNMRSSKLENPSSMRKHVEMHVDTIFDIEELVAGLQVSKPAVCPYFTSTRVLTIDADIIFTPFSYLVDPIIRNSSDVHLKESIVILDEAHNIEDTCREGASFTFVEREIADAVLSFKTKGQQLSDKAAQLAGSVYDRDREKFDSLLEYAKDMALVTDYLDDIWKWFQETAGLAKGRTPDPFTKQINLTKDWKFMVESLVNPMKRRLLLLKKDTKEHERIFQAYMAIAGVREEDQSNPNPLLEFKPSGAAIVMLEKWFYFNNFFQDDKYRTTYRLNICMEKLNYSQTQSTYKETKFDGQGPKNIGYNAAEDNWMDSSKGPWNVGPINPGHKTSISLWCMSPALTYTDAFSTCKSVILASGTLCPMDTLKTELGTQFKWEVEGKQVIPNEQIFASVLPVGPSGLALNLTQTKLKANPQTLEEVTEVIKDICLTVPRGILCFCPSYKMINTLMEIMREQSVGAAISRKKVIFEEPRVSANLNDVMQRYENALAHPRQYGPEVDGALMMAVFRGKISEGIDFADDKARVVISIGIPYPNFGDCQVVEKRKYNDDNHRLQGILNGENWYSTQAYRALNQALGRCLRHKNDWGALVLIDERLMAQAHGYEHLQPRSSAASSKVSKWIRDQLIVYSDYNHFCGSLAQFVKTMNPPPPPCEKRSIATVID